MTNATATPSVFSNTPNILPGHYRSSVWEGPERTFYSYLSGTTYAESVAQDIWREAQREDVLRDAYRQNKEVDDLRALRQKLMSSNQDTDNQDTEAALRQAELLGASADQRRKLREIVEARVAAERQVAELQAELERVRNEPITDPSDRRIWSIFGAAAAEADYQGYCSVYDQISTAVGIPDRDSLRDFGYLAPKRYDVDMEVTLTFMTTITVEADSYNEALREGDQMRRVDLWDRIDLSSLDYDSISEQNAHEAKEVTE